MSQEYLYVYEVYKEHSFTKAAKNLYVSQPALSATIKKVENRLGFKIFDRNTTSLHLTPEGEFFISIAEKILAAENDLNNYAQDLSSLQTGSLTIAGTSLYSSFIISSLVQQYTKDFPHVKLSFMEANSLLLYEEALSGNVDLIIDAGNFDKSEFQSEALFNEHLLVAIPNTNPIIQQYHLDSISVTPLQIREDFHLSDDCPSLDLGLLANENFILLKEGHDMHNRAVNLCETNNFTPNCSIHLDQLMTAFHVASKGLGITFITDTIIKHNYICAPLMYFRIATNHPDLLSREVFIAYRRDSHITKAMSSFILCGKNATLKY